MMINESQKSLSASYEEKENDDTASVKKLRSKCTKEVLISDFSSVTAEI